MDEKKGTNMKIKEILTSVGGPCIYRTAIFEDGTRSGRIQYTGQPKEQLEKELIDSVKSGRDDVRAFLAGI